MAWSSPGANGGDLGANLEETNLSNVRDASRPGVALGPAPTAEQGKGNLVLIVEEHAIASLFFASLG